MHNIYVFQCKVTCAHNLRARALETYRIGIFFFNLVIKTPEMPRAKFGKDWDFHLGVIGDLALALTLEVLQAD